MRIAQLANFVGPTSGGMKTAVDALGRGYAAAGIPRLLVVPGPRDHISQTPYGEVAELRAPRVGGGYRLLVEPWRVLDVLERFGPTSLEVSDKSTLLPVTRWARRRDVGSVLLSHERLDSMISLRTGLTRGVAGTVGVLNALLVRQFDAVVVTSRFAQREFMEAAHAVGTPLHRVPLGVDLDTVPTPGRMPRAGGPLRLVHFGRLSREKSPHLAVAAAVELHRRGVPARLDVYGDGPYRDELEGLVGRAPVFFHGHVEDKGRLSRLVAAADISISPCPGETFGLAILEALAVGTPVVTADTGGGRELLDEMCGDWGPATPAGLADAVHRLAARPVTETRRAARRRAMRFPWSAAVTAMLDIHGRVARSTSFPGLEQTA